MVPHRLYGHVDAAVNYSVAAFLADAEAALAEAARENQLPVFVGGTGLHFKALTVGLSKAPPVPADVRDALVRIRLAEKGPQALHTELAARDQAVAARLMPADRVRIARALEVIIATGRSIDEWNRDNAKPLLDPSATARVFLEPDRKDLYSRIDTRFDAMIAAGAARRSRGARQPQSRSIAARDEGAWRAVTDQADQRRDVTSGCDLQGQA